MGELVFGVPEIIWLILTGLGIGMICSKHGQPQDEFYEGGLYTFVLLLIHGLYYWGGFYDIFSYPQLLLIGIGVICAGVEIIRDGLLKPGNHNGWVVLVGSIVNTGILYWGGFFA